jgi:transcriptional regulator of acetoin/glycerol metabolism
MAALHSEGALQLCDMPSALQNHLAASTLQRFSAGMESAPAESFTLRPKRPVISLPQSEARTIRDALEAVGGERGKAANLLKIGRTTLYRKIREYNLA